MSSDPGSTGSSGDHRQGVRRGGLPEVFVADEQEAVPVDTDQWLRLVIEVLVAEGVEGDVEVSLLFVDEVAMAELNERFMGKTGPTDVLSFPIDQLADEPAPPGRRPEQVGPTTDRDDDDDRWENDDVPLILGDVVVCPAVAARNAPGRAGAHHDGSLTDELALLVVHGLLHLVGMDHEDEDEAEAMEARERSLLARFHRASGVST